MPSKNWLYDIRGGRNLPGEIKSPRRLCHALAGSVCTLALIAPLPARAMSLYDGTLSGNNLEISLDTTVSYTSFYRVNSPSAILISPVTNPNGSEGDLNFQHGFVGNVIEALPILDIKDGDLGAHFSGEYFVNFAYLHNNTNDQPDTINSFTVTDNKHFAPETVNSNGHNGRMLDAFAYDAFHFGGGQVLTLKAGQQTLFWGQSLFSTNGISGGQAPVDVVSAEDLVNPQVQQIFLPVGQIVATFQPNDTYTLQGYYQYQWESDSFQGVGSYFSSNDFLGPGAQRFIADTLPGLGNIYLFNTKALTPPSQNGQFGVSLQAGYGNYNLGLFALRYDSKTPTQYTYVNPPSHPLQLTPNGYSAGTYKFVYPRDIALYGASASATYGRINLAGEVSFRSHMNLAGSPLFPTAANPGNANSDPLYPVGDTMTGLTSFIYASPSLWFDPGGVQVVGEVQYVQLLKVTANPTTVAPGRTPAAASINLTVTPAYFEVFPNVELEFPVSVADTVAGNSEVSPSMNHGTGSFTVGVQAIYRQTWDASVNYVDNFGRPNPAAFAPNATSESDRGYVTFNIQHTF